MRQTAFALFIVLLTSPIRADEQGKQYYELREYRLRPSANAEQVDAYLSQALAPALTRLGAGPVGIFRELEEKPERVRFVFIPYQSIEQFAGVAQHLADDEEYQEAASEYLGIPRTDAPLIRIRSELLLAFDCMPELNVSQLSKEKGDRVFELRTYESSTERLGELKVEMFNSGEVPIFLDCGIEPVFFGQAVVGDLMPNLTYMTVYPSMEAKAEAWKKFPKHPDWIELKSVPKYQGTVSKIHKWNLVPLEGSQL